VKAIIGCCLTIYPPRPLLDFDEFSDQFFFVAMLATNP
jgi:hypothetical protein